MSLDRDGCVWSMLGGKRLRNVPMVGGFGWRWWHSVEKIWKDLDSRYELLTLHDKDPVKISLMLSSDCCLHEAQNCSSQLDPQRKGKAIPESASGEECQLCEDGCELAVWNHLHANIKNKVPEWMFTYVSNLTTLVQVRHVITHEASEGFRGHDLCKPNSSVWIHVVLRLAQVLQLMDSTGGRVPLKGEAWTLHETAFFNGFPVSYTRFY